MAPLCPWRTHHTRGRRVAQSDHRLCTSPSKCPWTRPAMHSGRGMDTTFPAWNAERMVTVDDSLLQLHLVGADGAGSPGERVTLTALMLLQSCSHTTAVQVASPVLHAPFCE